MTNGKPKRRAIRALGRAFVMEKRFQPLFTASTRVTRGQVHAWIVLADLRNGSLASLDRYLAQQGGISDRAVAIELRKLIAGSQHRSPYRLMVIEHPDRIKSKGGRPRSVQNKGTFERYRTIGAAYKRALALVGGRTSTALLEAAVELNLDTKTVKRAVKAVQKAELRAQAQVHSEDLRKRASVALSKRRDNALKNLRKGRKQPPSGGTKT